MREIIHLISSAKTGHFYTTMRNRQPNTEKLKLMKYDPVVRKRVEYVEGKGSASSTGKKGVAKGR